jgi:hypothetical protein
MLGLLDKINSRILLKITLLVVVEIILIVGSFSVLAFFQSQQSSLGNTINIAGNNRFLATNLLLQTEKYLDGFSSTLQVVSAINGLQFNIMTLKQGGIISSVDLKPLQSNQPRDVENDLSEMGCLQALLYKGSIDHPTRS